MRSGPARFALLFGLLTVALAACTDPRIFDEYHDFDNHAWGIDSACNFTFEVTDATIPYDIFYKIRNAANYEYYNLYVRFSLQDSLKQEIAGELQEMILFDPKTGKPYGGGLGDIFSHEFPAITGFKFPYKGRFTFLITQYMRTDPLQGIHSVGLRVDRAASKE